MFILIFFFLCFAKKMRIFLQEILRRKDDTWRSDRGWRKLLSFHASLPLLHHLRFPPVQHSLASPLSPLSIFALSSRLPMIFSSSSWIYFPLACVHFSPTCVCVCVCVCVCMCIRHLVINKKWLIAVFTDAL